jgi:hypothetical protein
MQMVSGHPCAVRAEHLNHLGIGEVQRPPDVVVDEVLSGAGVDDEHRARLARDGKLRERDRRELARLAPALGLRAQMTQVRTGFRGPDASCTPR